MKRLPILLIASVLLSAACSGTLMGPRAPDETTMEEIKARILELQRSAAMTRVELDRLRRELGELQARLDATGPGGSAAAGEAALERDDSAGAVMVEEVIERSDLPLPPPVEPPAAPPREAAAAAALPPQEAPPSAAAAESLQPMTAPGQALYDRGYTLYHQGRYVDAEAAFRRFLQEHPRTELSDNAQYWIGESRFARQDLEAALAAFQETVERYPEGNKVPDSLLKIADCLEGLGDVAGARSTYDEVIRRFPSAAAAAIAEERRAKLP